MNFRLRFLLLFFGLGFLFIFVRLFQIQILDHDRYRDLAASEHWRSLEIPARRGQIFSQEGTVLVGNKTAYLLYAYPKEIEDEKDYAEKLGPILFDEGLYTDEEKKLGLINLKFRFIKSLEQRLSRPNLYWASLYHKVSTKQKEAIEKLNLKGLGFEEEPQRFYPEGDLASYVLGFVGVDSLGREKGYYGLEGYYNGDLKGEPGKILEEQTAGGYPILLGGYQQIPSVDGRSLHLTLNRSVQYLVEKELARGVNRYGARSGTVIVMDPNSGAVIAMASFPNFDPASWLALAQRLRSVDEGESIENLTSGFVSFRNPAIAETYEPGSALKAVTMSAGIDSSTVTPQTTFVDGGPIVVSGYKIDNWDGRHHGEQTMIEVLQKSNNMGAAFVARKMGPDILRSYWRKFGLGERLGVDLEGEESGKIKEASEFREVDLVTNSFGQGIAVTPLQLTSIFSTIANGGKLFRPYIVEKLSDPEKEISFGAQFLGQVLSPAKAKVMIEMLTAAAEGGEAKFFVLKKYRVAGKTGTAQIPVPGGYDPNKTNATFAGFLPGNNKFVMLVKLNQPSTSIYAAETAVPLWMEITKGLVTHFGIPPDR